MTGADAKDPRTLLTLFDSASERFAQRSALVVPGPGPDRQADQVWTHSEVADRSRAVGRLLLDLAEAGANTSLVAVLTDHTPHAITAVIGCLRAGLAYVPLEPSWPVERIAALITDIGPVAIVADRSTAATVADLRARGIALPVVLADDIAADELALPPTGPVVSWSEALSTTARDLPAIDPDARAYVIFTSGSTGRPKGVEVRHRSVVGLIKWVNEAFGIGPDDRLLTSVSFAFDLSVYDMFGVLAAGGSLLVAPDRVRAEPGELAALLLRPDVSVWNSAPSALAAVLPFVAPGDARSDVGRTLVLLSGDWAPLSCWEDLRSRFADLRLIVLGGATECTVWSNWFEVTKVDPSWRSIPYGRPMPGVRYLVLDGQGRPCPPGVEGDLFIAGPCLAAGYWRAADLTAERFGPVSGEERAYRTGDRVQLMPDGQLEFLGRRDDQIKVRGYRVELGEVRTALGRVPGVRESVVFAARGLDGPVVAAAVVLGTGTTTTDVRARLADELPGYMLPAPLFAVDALPLTSSGKPDLGSLARAAENPVPNRRPPEAPVMDRFAAKHHSDVEQIVSAVWTEILNRPAVADADFFASGGNSMTAVELAAGLSEDLGNEVGVRDVFTHRTLGALIEHVTALRAGPATDARPVDAPA